MVSIFLSILIIAGFCFWVDREEGREYLKKNGYTRKAFRHYRKMMNNPDYRKEQKNPFKIYKLCQSKQNYSNSQNVKE